MTIDEIEKDTENKSRKKRQNKQVAWVLFLILSVIIITIGIPLIKNNFFNKFDNRGMDFQKTITGNVVFYHSDIPITDINYETISSYQIELREDPRKLDSIKVDVPDNEVAILRNKPVFISLASDLPICEKNLVSIGYLTKFLYDFGELKVKSSTNNLSFAIENNYTYVTCENTQNNTVIIIKHGNESSIKRTWKNCYELEYKDCEINQVTERFILIILEKYMDELKRLQKESS
ncbi:MAG: hypothetical protein WC867_07685 [Candidatus Pacearchaeota archaeon]|jgi:hypothetical protein